jgi:DNA-binding CsgD family transcriptional regulator
MNYSREYTYIMTFITKFLPSGFSNISRTDPAILDLERHLMANHQFFYVADELRLKIHFVTRGSQELIGVDPDQWDMSSFIERVHPDDLERFIRSRVQLIKRGYELAIKKQGISILSCNVRVHNSFGKYLNLLFQSYSFYNELPHTTVYLVLLVTDLSSCNLHPHGYHYYEGNDLAYFRYPDETLLEVGHIFSAREFEIIKLIADGYGSEQIADKLKLSVNTVNTHRRNILKKTKKSTTHELVIELQERGML